MASVPKHKLYDFHSNNSVNETSSWLPFGAMLDANMHKLCSYLVQSFLVDAFTIIVNIRHTNIVNLAIYGIYYSCNTLPQDEKQVCTSFRY